MHPARIITQASSTTRTHSGKKKATRIPSPKADTVIPMCEQLRFMNLSPYGTVYAIGGFFVIITYNYLVITLRRLF